MGFLQRMIATIPATATTLEGVPTVRIDSAEAGTTRRVLSAPEAARSRLTISLVDGRWNMSIWRLGA